MEIKTKHATIKITTERKEPMKAMEVIEKVRNSYGKINRKKAEPITYEKMELGTVHWQGDIGIVRIEHVPYGCQEIKPVAKLVSGDTKGSRHILKHLNGVKMFRLNEPTALDGPVMILEESNTITHPEHGNVTLNECDAIYHIRYQRAYAQELRRVKD